MATFEFTKRNERPAFKLVVPEADQIASRMLETGKTALLAWIIRGAVANNCDLTALADLPSKVLTADALIAEIEQAQASSSSIINAATFAEYWPEVVEPLEAKFGDSIKAVRMTLELACGHNGKNKLSEKQTESILRNFTGEIHNHEIFAVAVAAARFRKAELAKQGDF